MGTEPVTPNPTPPPDRARTANVPGAGDERGAGQSTKLLIVDDSPITRDAVRQIVAPEHECIEVSTTSQAIAAISLNRIDAVLIGLAAPEVGAVDFCRTLKKTTATQFLPVLITARREDIDAEVRAIEAGADGFFSTPLQPRLVRARLQASIRHKAMIESIDGSEAVLFSLAQSVEDRDPALSQHCRRMAILAAAMGLALGLSPEEIVALQRGAYLHDIGKVAIPDNILFKPGPLTQEEWEIMKTHAERGERICSSIRSLAPVLPIIRNHHEKWDGSGYPDGLKGQQIPLLARILQLADIYDALTTTRPYKVALGPEQALAIMWEETAKGWRDPELMKVFADIAPVFGSDAPPDLSHVSLHALARSINGFRQHPNRTPRREALAPGEQLKLVSGL